MIEHTADIGIEALADTREGLVVQSGYGLRMLLFGESGILPTHLVKLVITGNTGEETLVNWLNELLFLMSERGLVPAVIKVRHFTDTEISAEVQGDHPDLDGPTMLREIKAVTHHQTSIDHDDGCWRSRVYIDL